MDPEMEYIILCKVNKSYYVLGTLAASRKSPEPSAFPLDATAMIVLQRKTIED